MAGKKAKRADDRYVVTMTVGHDALGKAKRKFFYGATQKEAKAKMDAYKNELHSGKTQGRLSLHDWIEKWVEVSASKETTQKSNKLYARKLDKTIGKVDLADIRMIDIARFAQSISGMSYSTVKKTKAVTNRIFQDAVQNRLITYNPCIGVRWEYGSKGTHRALTASERKFIVEWHRVHRAGLWALLMLFAGLRRGEALALLWEDIDFKEDVIHVTKAIHFEGNKGVLSTTKTEAGVRDVPLLPQLKACLLQYDRREGRVCRNSNGEPVDTQAAFKRGWEGWLAAMENIMNGEPPFQPGKRNDLRDDTDRKKFFVRTHDLRHTFCTMLYKASVGLKEAQYIMGHADSSMTLEVYTHLDEESKMSAAVKLKGYTDVFDDEV